MSTPEGNPQARRIADEALGVLSATLGPVAEERFQDAYGNDWRTSRGIRANGLGARVSSLRDPQELLGRIQPTPEFDKTFGPLMQAGRDVFQLAADLKDRRNLLVHRVRSWEASDAWSVVKRTAEVLDAFGLLRTDAKVQLDALEIEAAAIVGGGRVSELASLRRDYIQGLLDATTYLDSSGINAGVASRVVKVRLEDVYVEPRLVEPRLAGQESDVADGEHWAPATLDALPRVVVIAGPGAGKTTLLRRIARRAAVSGAAGSPGTPILLTARAYAGALEFEPGLSLRRYIGERLTDRFGDLLLSELDLGRATVLVDGLDEVVDEAARNRVAGLVGEFTREHPNVRLIATSRVVGFRMHPSWSAFTQLAIQDFDEEQRGEFVQGWARTLASETQSEGGAEELLRAIEASEGAKELASTPLLLTIVVLLWHRGARLPDQMAELYDLATVTLLRDWPTRRLGRSFDDRRMIRLLEPIALELIQSGEASIGEGAVLKRWAGLLANAEGLDASAASERAFAVLSLVQEQTGILAEVGREAAEPRYAFLHKTFAEYLAARGLAEEWDAGTLDLGRYVHRSRWLPVVDFLVGHIGLRGVAAGTKMVHAVLEADAPSEQYLRGDVGLAVKYLALGLEVEPATRDEIVSLAVDRVLDPTLEIFRTVRGRQLTTIRDRVPRRTWEPRLQPSPDASPRLRARKRWLRLLMDPASDDDLAGFLASIPDLVEGSPDGSFDVEAALGEVGATSSDVNHLGHGIVFVGPNGSELLAVTASDRLVKAGLRHQRLDELPADDMPIGEFEPWLPDYESLLGAPLATIVPILARTDLSSSILEYIARVQIGHLADVVKLAQEIDAGTLEIPAKAIPWLVKARDEALSDDPAEEDDDLYELLDELLERSIAKGSSATRQAALYARLLPVVGLSTERWTELEAAIADDPTVARAVGLALAAKSLEFIPEGLDAWAERVVAVCPDAVARGLARRGLAAARRLNGAGVIGMLGNPDVAVPAEAFEPFDGNDTAHVVGLLLNESGNSDVRRAAARIAGSILTVGPDDDWAWGWAPEDVLSHDFENLASELANSDRVESRRWSARLLQHLERTGAGAGAVLAKLVCDPDPIVQDLAVNAINAADLDERDWIEPALLRVFDLPMGPSTEVFPFHIASSLPRAVVDDLVPLVEAFLDDHPGSPGALVFLDTARAGLA